MVACNVGVTKTALGSTLVVSEMAGFVTLPTTLIAAIVSLVLTSEIGLIDSQRRRLSVDVDGPDLGDVDHAAMA
jgi:H+/Cl- antiporter ClcA